ncbi:MAG: glutathione synthase [Gammaproteobacteria bacterium]|nr:glutathione synthase [Gammaproteobacteria bacterium]
MKICVIMDPIENISPKKDTSFAILLAAQERKWPIYYAEIHDLYLKGENAFAQVKQLRVTDHEKNWFSIEKTEHLALDFFDVIFMRKEPPIDQTYLHATQILDFAEKKGVRVYNKPQSLRDYNEKLFIHHFSHLAPETLISANQMELRRFISTHQICVCKPLDGMGGESIFKVQNDDPNLSVILEILTQKNQKHIVCQRYIPDITQGDKRIILINGEPIPYALARLPQKGETRGNLAAGGSAQGVALSKNDNKICEEVGPFLKKNGILLAGLDVIGDYLTEINITSPTCVRELEGMFKIDITEKILQAIDKN